MGNAPVFVLSAVLILSGCSPSPPPLPYVSTAGERIEVVDVEHEVSRVWRCGWAGKCPQETWRYCLAIHPLTDEAAVKWYGLYHAEHLERARYYVEKIARGEMQEAPVAPVPTHTAEGRPLAPHEVEEENRRHAVLTRMEHFRREVQLYDRKDPEFRRRIIERMKAGVRMQAHFSVSGSGSDRSASGWRLVPDC